MELDRIKLHLGQRLVIEILPVLLRKKVQYFPARTVQASINSLQPSQAPKFVFHVGSVPSKAFWFSFSSLSPFAAAASYWLGAPSSSSSHLHSTHARTQALTNTHIHEGERERGIKKGATTKPRGTSQPGSQPATIPKSHQLSSARNHGGRKPSPSSLQRCIAQEDKRQVKQSFLQPSSCSYWSHQILRSKAAAWCFLGCFSIPYICFLEKREPFYRGGKQISSYTSCDLKREREEERE